MADKEEEAARRGIEIWQLEDEKSDEDDGKLDFDPNQINSSSTRRKRLQAFKDAEQGGESSEED